jgi:hypothetical protein
VNKYEKGLHDGIKGLVDPEMQDQDYVSGVKEGERRWKLFIASTEDHGGISCLWFGPMPAFAAAAGS